MGAHIRPQKRISEAKSHGTAVPWLFLRRNLFYAEHTPSSGSVQAQRSRFDLSWYLFLRCATVPARFRFRPFGRACLPLIPDAPDCICSPGHLWFWVVWASCLGAAAPISIHAPRVGRDESGDSIERLAQQFQSTRPVWGATRRRWRTCSARRFQSTRPVWGATECMCTFRCVITNFNPRAPCGARRTRKLRDFRRKAFQSTRPVWGATANLTILTRQICTKGTKEFLLGRKTHEERGKITQKLAYIHAFSAFFRCEGARTFCALVLRTQ